MGVSSVAAGLLRVYPDLSVSCGPVRLMVPSVEQTVILARIASNGLFAEGQPSTLGPWYDPDDPVGNGRSVAGHLFSSWAQRSVVPSSMPFVVVDAGNVVVGTQSLEDTTGSFAVTGELGTGSWLDPQRRGQGLGTYARWAALAFGFTVAGATTMVSRALDTNVASNGVSVRCGYTCDGVDFVDSAGVRSVVNRWRMDRVVWCGLTKPDVVIVGAEQLQVRFAQRR